MTLKPTDTGKQIVSPKITVDHDKCISCGSCLEVCPYRVYELKEYKKDSKRKRRIPVPVNVEDCIFCQACQAQCPPDAITIES